jgi:hypothetical protein
LVNNTANGNNFTISVTPQTTYCGILISRNADQTDLPIGIAYFIPGTTQSLTISTPLPINLNRNILITSFTIYIYTTVAITIGNNMICGISKIPISNPTSNYLISISVPAMTASTTSPSIYQTTVSTTSVRFTPNDKLYVSLHTDAVVNVSASNILYITASYTSY